MTEIHDNGQFFGFTEDKMFGWVMSEPDICEHILRIILPDKDIHLVSRRPETQEVLDTPGDSKNGRLDVLAADRNGTLYDIEMQTTNGNNLGQRMRYYQSQLDQHTLHQGQNYNQMRKTIIVFLCSFANGKIDGVNDFRGNRVRYEFATIEKEDRSFILNTGSEFVMINGKGRLRKRDNQELSKLLRLMDNLPVEGDPVFKKAEELIAWNNYDTERRQEIMTYEQKLLEREEAGIEEGRKEGRKEGAEEERRKQEKEMGEKIRKLITQNYADGQTVDQICRQVKLFRSEKSDDYIRAFVNRTIAENKQ